MIDDSFFGSALQPSIKEQRESHHSQRGRKLQDVPDEILDVSNWSAWRRFLRLPNAAATARIECWRLLVDRLTQTSPQVPSPLPGTRRHGIFGISSVRWQAAGGSCGRSESLKGMALSGARPAPARLTNPMGPLAITQSIREMNCDILDIEGIGASRSADRHFDTIEEFGRNFCHYKKVSVSPEGLMEMLKHRDIRIIHGNGSDFLSVELWDGRLFLRNDGGSHHFAGAAFIARALNAKLPIQGRLEVTWLNPSAWRWLLDRFRLLYVPTPKDIWFKVSVASLMGECFEMQLPPVVAPGLFALLPRHGSCTGLVCGLLERHGCTDVSKYVHDLLHAQEQTACLLKERWPLLGTLPNFPA